MDEAPIEAKDEEGCKMEKPTNKGMVKATTNGRMLEKQKRRESKLPQNGKHKGIDKHSQSEGSHLRLPLPKQSSK